MYDDYKIKPLQIMIPKTSAYVKRCDGQTKTKCMYFLIEDGDFMGKYNNIWNKFSADINKEFGIKPFYIYFF